MLLKATLFATGIVLFATSDVTHAAEVTGVFALLNTALLWRLNGRTDNHQTSITDRLDLLAARLSVALERIEAIEKREE